MNLYILRHGETDWNKALKMQGQSDIPLNDYGRELAVKTGEGLKDVDFDYVFSSPLIRAVETAEIVLAGKNVSIEKDDRIKEISFGVYEGMRPEERPANFNDFFKAPDKFIPGEGAESYYDLCNRTKEFIESVILPLAKKEPAANVMISGHGAMNKSLLLYFKNLEIKDIWSGPFQKNCCVTLIEINNDKYNFIYENKIFYEEKEYRPLWKIRKIYEDDYGCEERPDGQAKTYIVEMESEKGVFKTRKFTEEFLDKNEILEGRFIPDEIINDNIYTSE